MTIDIPAPCAAVIKKLNDAGYEAFLVGGCVRDSLLGKTPSDWDICTDALPDAMLTVFQHNKVIPTGLKHGTLTVLQGGMALEITTYRVDGEYVDHRRPEEVRFTDRLEEDLSRRDFTINAMAWHPQTGVVDPFGGLEDLKAHIVRAVGDPYLRFEEDGLRILRLVRFATSLGFGYDDVTEEAAKEKAYLLRFISAERKQYELNRILLSEQVARGLIDCSDLDLFPHILPQKCHEVGFIQHNNRHFLDVFEHSALSTGLVPADLTLRLTMMLHDIGKPFTWMQNEQGEDEFSGHEAVGAAIAHQFLRDLRYDNHTRKRVVTLVRHHNDVITDDPLLIRRLLRLLGKQTVYDLIEVKIADILAHGIGYDKRLEVLSFFETVKQAVDTVVAGDGCWEIKHLAVDGKDLLARGYRGREIGQTLDKLLDIVVEKPTQNTFTVLEAALSAYPPGWTNSADDRDEDRIRGK